MAEFACGDKGPLLKPSMTPQLWWMIMQHFLAAILFREGKDENELNFIGCVCVNLNTVWLKFLLLKYRGIYDGNFSY